MPYGVWLLRPDAGRETVLCGTEEARRVRDPGRLPVGQTYEDGTSLAEIAVINELGSSDTPARPFMRQSFENHEAELQAACDRANAILSNGGTAEQALNQLGVFCVGSYRRRSSKEALHRTQSRPSRRRGPTSR